MKCSSVHLGTVRWTDWQDKYLNIWIKMSINVNISKWTWSVPTIYLPSVISISELSFLQLKLLYILVCFAEVIWQMTVKYDAFKWYRYHFTENIYMGKVIWRVLKYGRKRNLFKLHNFVWNGSYVHEIKPKTCL